MYPCSNFKGTEGLRINTMKENGNQGAMKISEEATTNLNMIPGIGKDSRVSPYTKAGLEKSSRP